MKALSREFWQKMVDEHLKAWDNRSCMPCSREYLKLNAKAERASTIIQMMDTMDAEVEIAVKQTWAPMAQKCLYMRISMHTNGAVCTHDGWSDTPVCYMGRCPLLKKEV